MVGCGCGRLELSSGYLFIYFLISKSHGKLTCRCCPSRLPGWLGERGRGVAEKCMQCVHYVLTHMLVYIFWEKVSTVFIIFSQEVCDPPKSWVLLGLCLSQHFRLFCWKLHWPSDTLAWLWGPTVSPRPKFWTSCCLCRLRAIWTKGLVARISVGRHKWEGHNFW